MAERTKERSDEEQSTEDLLAETDALLNQLGEDAGAGGESGGTKRRRNADAGSVAEPSVPDAGTGTGSESTAKTGSRLDGVVPDRFPITPRGLLATLLVVTAGMFAGGTFLPVLGTSLGMFGAGFLLGLVRSRRSYLEAALVGAGLGGAVAFINNLQFAIWANAGVPLAALGAGIGLLAVVLGVYFGRDLKKGLTQDITGGE